MSKKNQAVVEQVNNEQVETTTVATVETKTYEVPLDGSKADEYIKSCGSVSAAIRTLTSKGYSRGEVAKALNKRYQHVRNVLLTPVKKTQGA